MSPILETSPSFSLPTRRVFLCSSVVIAGSSGIMQSRHLMPKS
jgi:hypothetical protein